MPRASEASTEMRPSSAGGEAGATFIVPTGMSTVISAAAETLGAHRSGEAHSLDPPPCVAAECVGI